MKKLKYAKKVAKPAGLTSFKLSPLSAAVRDIMRNPEKYSKPLSEYATDDE